MIELYTWGTPNGRKVSIMLEECGLPYRVHTIDIMRGEQFAPAYLAINPNGKIPAILDPDGPDERHEKAADHDDGVRRHPGLPRRQDRPFLPESVRGKYEALQWLMFQMGGVGRCSARRIISCATPRSRWTTPSAATARRRRGSTA
ncbi:MAG: glutathione S-transferase [Rhodocyclaceae bacterium]|nr:glutathione S-transferase [Rhodocyclaceae bacterium]